MLRRSLLVGAGVTALTGVTAISWASRPAGAGPRLLAWLRLNERRSAEEWRRALGALRDAGIDEIVAQVFPSTHALYASKLLPMKRAVLEDLLPAARALQQRLLAGAEPSGLGDLCVHGQRFGERNTAAYAGIFGEAFAAALSDMPVGTWSLAPSSLGWHVVRVDSSRPAALPGLAALRPRLRADWEAERRDASSAAALAELRARYPTTLRDVPPALAAALAAQDPL